VASAAPVTMLVEPGPMEAVQAKEESRTGGGGGLTEGRTGTKNGRPVVVKGGKLLYSDDGTPAQ